MKYSIEELIEEFAKHAAEYDRMTAEWNEQNPTTQRDIAAFVLPRALHAIVSEIKKLKDQANETHQPQIPTDLPK